MPTTIEIVIDPQGKTNTTVKGMKGEGCHALTANLEAKLGTAEMARNTEEFYEEPHEIEIDQKHG